MFNLHVGFPIIILLGKKEGIMLILTRRVGESINIGDEVTVTVLYLVLKAIRYVSVLKHPRKSACTAKKFTGESRNPGDRMKKSKPKKLD